MPQTIRQTLLVKLQNSQTLADLRKDLEVMTGIQLRLAGPSLKTTDVSQACSDTALCRNVRDSAKGAIHCQRFIEGLVQDTNKVQLACHQCDAGMTGFCVPIRFAGETVGYLLAGGYKRGGLDQMGRNRLRHLLGRMEIEDVEGALSDLEYDTIAVSNAKHDALLRWLQLAANALIRTLELKDDATDRPLPTFVVKICSMIQANYQEPPTLPEAASICGLSEGYFCRSFHEFTGLRFLEYIHAVRIEHVCDMLLDRDVSITDAAFAVGFNSLSQFNRVFRKLKGKSPRQWRKEHGLVAQP